MRTFEVSVTITLLINDYRDGIENLFNIEKEILVYKNIDELIEILEKLKKIQKNFTQLYQMDIKEY